MRLRKRACTLVYMHAHACVGSCGERPAIMRTCSNALELHEHARVQSLLTPSDRPQPGEFQAARRDFCVVDLFPTQRRSDC